MADASTLRSTLSKTDMTQPAIQSSAAAMMRFYDKNAAPLAVSEWRSALQTGRPDQLLPLLYVANEVLQTSKRNRGPKFLEAFAEVLGSSLRYICERDRSIVEKVRRTAKIWGDRQVYSTRFVGQLLGGLEDLRGGGGSGGGSGGGNGSASASASASSPAPATTATLASAAPAGEKKRSVTDDEEDQTLPPKQNGVDDDDDEDDDDDNAFSSPFGSSGGQSLLSIDITASAAAARGSSAAAKRRRGSGSSPANPPGSSSQRDRRDGGGHGNTRSNPPKKKKKKLAKSTQNFMSLVESLASLEERYRSACGTLDSIDRGQHLNDDDDNHDDLADVVGDELIDLNRGAAAAARTLRRQERSLHGIATEKRRLEGEVAEYIPWLRAALKADEEELTFCAGLEQKLRTVGVVHAEAKQMREVRREEEAQRTAQEMAERRAREEEEERKRALEEAMKAPDQEAKPDTKWNPVTREYQYVGDVTEESWRD